MSQYRRSILSVPGHQQKMHVKASQTNADVIMLDLEDSVPVQDKVTARSQVVQSLTTMNWQNKVMTVRINSLDTQFAYQDLIELGEHAGQSINAFVIPKVNHPGDIYFVDRLLQGIELSKKFSQHLLIEASIETAQGLENVSAIAKVSHRLIALVFGIADYSASIGARLISISGHGENEDVIYPGHRWHFALSRMVMAAKANGLFAIDAPYGNFKDHEGLNQSASMAAALGCNGKWAIHPSQIDTIHTVFTPTQEEIQRATQIITAFELQSNCSKGAIAIEGRMVDHATYRMAKQLLNHII